MKLPTKITCAFIAIACLYAMPSGAAENNEQASNNRHAGQGEQHHNQSNQNFESHKQKAMLHMQQRQARIQGNMACVQNTVDSQSLETCIQSARGGHNRHRTSQEPDHSAAQRQGPHERQN